MSAEKRRRAWVVFWLLALSGSWSAAARAQYTAAYYAGEGSFAFDPDFWWGWTPHFVVPDTPTEGISVVNDEGTGLNAWGIEDNVATSANPFYSQCIDGVLSNGACAVGLISNTAKQTGWRYSTTARFVDDYGTDASMGLSLWLENRGYFVLFDLSGSNLRATLYNSTGGTSSIVLTSGGVGAKAYHEFALTYLPATRRVAFEFDGVIKGYTTGLAQTHENAMLWGNLSTNGRGRMHFHDVEFQLTLAGDYNRDNIVDAADYTVWRNSVGTNLSAADGDENGRVDAADYVFWKQRFGDFGPLVLDFATGTPEPASWVLGVMSANWLMLGVRGRRSSPQVGRIQALPLGDSVP